MATQQLILKAALKWANIFEENRDMEGYEGGAKAYGGEYKVNLILEGDELKKLQSAGSRLNAKIDKDDDMVITARRKHQDRFPETSGAPKVFHLDGKEWNFITDGALGNGTEAKVRLGIYDSKAGKGTRLESVVITKHVPFDDMPKQWDEEMFEGTVEAAEVPF